MKNHSHQKIHIALVGNKTDLASEREVSEERALEFVKKHGIDFYYETSAFTGHNVEKVYFDLGVEVLNKVEKGVINIDLDTAYGVKRGKKGNRKYPSSNVALSREPPKVPEQKGCNC